MKKHILFDFDGTIVNSKMLFFELYNELADEQDLQRISLAEVEQWSQLSLPKRFLKMNIPIFKLPMIINEMKTKLNEVVPTIQMVDGMGHVLQKLNESGYNISILSSNSTDVIEQFCHTNQLDYIQDVYSSAHIFGKHHSLEKYVDQYDISKQQVLYVGDEYRDIAACKKAEIPIIAVTWGFDAKTLLEEGEPNYLVDDPTELSAVIHAYPWSSI
ncbi:HAD hydrolase-like protein [Longirhabdus pacifica]|uniref:HAD hydrolase-like protein n=1 Tax=Longirhabdus pacifica TaxID=2305227 RepID=UPI001008CFBF|nr:HAD hydrolase-like protein [Longirhabdus pacifica]